MLKPVSLTDNRRVFSVPTNGSFESSVCRVAFVGLLVYKVTREFEKQAR